MNLRILIYLNPSNIDKVTHEFKLEADSGFVIIKNSILALNKYVDWHFYILVPDLNCWRDRPNNVTLIEYPYINDALNSRFHFNSVVLNDVFSNYRQDIDFIWSMLPEVVANLKAFAIKRREELPIFTFINWMDYKKTKGYEPSYKLRMLEGILEADIVGIQSHHMLNTMKEILSGHEITEDKIHIMPPKTISNNTLPEIGNIIGFPHRVSTESGFYEMYNLIKDHLNMKLWISNINNAQVEDDPNVVNEYFADRELYYQQISNLRFGISYHINYSMWSMSVLDMLAHGKCVLAPNKNAFPEMFPDNYPYLFNDNKEFLSMFKHLQSCNKKELLKWGQKCMDYVNNRFTWDIQAKTIKRLFMDQLHAKKTNRAKDISSIIRKYNAITKSDLINKNMTEFHRRISRSWNKTRIDMMRNYGIKDDITSSETIFYYDCERYTRNRIEKRGTMLDQLTIYDIIDDKA